MAEQFELSLPGGNKIAVREEIKSYYDQALKISAENPIPLTFYFISEDLQSYSRDISRLETDKGFLRELVESKQKLVESKQETIDLMRSRIIQLEEELLKGEAKSRAAAGSL